MLNSILFPNWEASGDLLVV